MTAPKTILGTVTRAGRIETDDGTIDGVILEVNPTALRDHPGNLIYQNMVLISLADYEALLAAMPSMPESLKA
jgi:hypothetical protein